MIAVIASPVCGQRLKLEPITADPYVSALVIDAESGAPLAMNNALAPVYPASVLKLMDLYVILDLVRQGRVNLGDRLTVSEEAYRMGGSQVYLDVGEQFTIEDMLYAIMIQSANDAAVALAEHIAGSKEAFVEMMNARARDLGMHDTRFTSVHGLPPEVGQQPDVSTARDIAILCRALVKMPGALTYTSTKERSLRDGAFVMRTHNRLLSQVPGCDGLKTGYFKAAGFSIAATAERNGRRVIAVVMGSTTRQARDHAAAELLEQGFRELK